MSSFLSGGGGNTQKVIKYDALQIGTSQYDIPIMLFWGQRRISFNTLWYNDFKAKKVKAKGKGAGGKGGQQYTYTAAVILGLGEGEIDEILNVWEATSTTTVTTLAELGFVFFSGTAAQTPWSFVATSYPDEALSYAYTSYVANPRLNLGSSATVPENAFEARRLMGFTDVLTTDGFENPTSHVITPGKDVNLADVIEDMLTNTQYGMQFGGAAFGTTLETYRSYQENLGLYFSPYLTNQETVTEVLNRWAEFSNTWIYWNGTQFVFIPLGDITIGSYVPDVTPAYNLVMSDFVGDVPVKVSRRDPADCYNRLLLQYTDRSAGYIARPAEYKDQTLIDEFGLKDGSSTNADEICVESVAKTVVRLMGQRESYIRNTYEFSTTERYIRLVPGSIVTLTEANAGLSQQLVRIREVTEEDEEGTLRFLAEELPLKIGTGINPGSQAPPATSFPNNRIDPGDVNTPSIVEPDSSFDGGARLLVSASGGVNWGGAEVYCSFDGGTNYVRVGTISQPAVQGVLTAGLADHVDPDTVNTLSVNLAQTETEPEPVTNADADAFRTLSQIVAQPVDIGGGVMEFATQGELIAFGDVAATGTYTANLTYLRRGIYGSTHAAHLTGAQFSFIDSTLIDGGTIGVALPLGYIGGPISFKFASFNSFGEMTQDLSLVTEYQYTPKGTGYGSGTDGIPATPATPTVAALSYSSISVTWAPNPTTDNVQMYSVYRAPGLGAVFGAAVKIWDGATIYYKDVGLAGSTGYTYFVVANNAAGSSGPSAGASTTTAATPYVPTTPALTALSLLTPAADFFPYWTGPTTAANTGLSAFSRTVLDDTTQGAWQTTLALVPGTNVQAQSANLNTFSGIAPSANVQSVLGAANYAAIRTLLTLVPGTDIQAYSANGAALAGLTGAADLVPYFTGVGAMTTMTVTSAARTVLDDTTTAAMLTTLGALPLAGGTMTGSFTTRTSTTGAGTEAIIVPSGGLVASAIAGAIANSSGNWYFTKVAAQRVGLSGPIFSHSASVQATTTETDLYTDTILANMLDATGSYIEFMYAGSFVGHASRTRQLRVYWAGGVIFDTTAEVVATSCDWIVTGQLVRGSSSVLRCEIYIIAAGAATPYQVTITVPTGQDFTINNILKITGQCGAGSASGDISSKLGIIEYKSAAA